MNSYRNNNRKNRYKHNGERNFRKRSISGHKNHSEFNSNSEFKHRNPGRNNQNASKLIEKYNNLAREALSSGDKILSENYLQHADHFSRILSIQELNKVENRENNVIEQDFKKDKSDIDVDNKKKLNNDNVNSD